MTPADIRQHQHYKPALRAMGQQVRQRLAANPRVWPFPTEKAEIFAVGEFMNADECARMMTMIDAVARPSSVLGDSYENTFRTSYSGDVDPHDPFVKKLDRRLDDLMGVDTAWGETIQGQRYEEGQQFKAHNDWFYPDTGYWTDETRRGGQRAWTAMVYLNDVTEGGTTEFTEVAMAVEPKQGTLILWNNALPDGMPNEATMHAGRPVMKGSKYVITKWYRAQPWR